MTSTTNKEKFAYSPSAPRNSSPTSPSVFLFPEKASHSGESPPRYGKRKTTDSANISSPYGEDSPHPRLFEHQDSATLYGDRKFQSHGISRLKSRCAASKASCHLKGKVELEVSNPPEANTALYTSPPERTPPSSRVSPPGTSTNRSPIRTTPRRTGRLLSSPTVWASSPASDERNLRYSLSDIRDILPDSPLDSAPSAEFNFDDISGSDSSDRVSYMGPFDLSQLPSSRALKSAPEKKQKKKTTAVVRQKSTHIQTLCCNIAREFPRSVPYTYSSQSARTKRLRDTSKPTLRSLAANSFNSFVSQPDPVTVMFHNSLTNKPASLEDWKTLSQSSTTSSQYFASVDCAIEAPLCAREGVSKFPLYKLYSKGSAIKVVEDLGQL